MMMANSVFWCASILSILLLISLLGVDAGEQGIIPGIQNISNNSDNGAAIQLKEQLISLLNRWKIEVQEWTNNSQEFLESQETYKPGITEKCYHQKDLWKCCIGVEMKFNLSSCISIEYFKDELGLELNVTFDDLLIFHNKVSARNIPPVCFPIPYLEKMANICFRFHDLERKNKLLKGCVRFEGHVEGLNKFKHELGCFKIPLPFVPNSIQHNVADNVQMYRF